MVNGDKSNKAPPLEDIRQDTNNQYYQYICIN